MANDHGNARGVVVRYRTATRVKQIFGSIRQAPFKSSTYIRPKSFDVGDAMESAIGGLLWDGAVALAQNPIALLSHDQHGRDLKPYK